MDIQLTLLDSNGGRFVFSVENARFLSTDPSYDSSGFKPEVLESLIVHNGNGTVWAFTPDADTAKE
jgi:hypothetical protein